MSAPGARCERKGEAADGAEDERERLVAAFTKIAAERGYAATTVADVARTAGLSTEAFHRHFADRRRILIAAFDSFIQRLLDETERAIDAESDWPDQVRAAVSAGVGFVAETSRSARLFAIEALTVGPPILERYFAATARLARMLRAGRRRYPRAAQFPEQMEWVLVTGVGSLVVGALLAEDPSHLSEMEGQLVELFLTPFLGLEEARRIASS
jgi:AcrR family transcriptional regulator